MNYGLLVVASLRSKRALFPLNDPLTPTTGEGACNGASALHAVYDKETQANFKIYERVISALKFELSG